MKYQGVVLILVFLLFYIVLIYRWRRAEGFYLGEDFWDAFEKVTKINVPIDERGNFIFCSC